MKKNAQTAIEFVILTGFILFFFTTFFLAIQGNMSDKLKQKQNLMLKETALAVQDEINLALDSSDGYYREFEVPEKIGNQDYDISLVDDMVYLKTKDEKLAMSLPIAKVTGQVVKGQNTIKKENGEVKINS